MKLYPSFRPFRHSLTSHVLSTQQKYRCSDLFSEGYGVERAPVVANGLVPEHPLLPDLEQEPSVQIRHLAAKYKGRMIID